LFFFRIEYVPVLHIITVGISLATSNLVQSIPPNTPYYNTYRCILLSITNKMQRYTIFFINVNAPHVSGGFSAHHQELKTVHTQHLVYVKLPCCYR
jgi:hypothetical protein